MLLQRCTKKSPLLVPALAILALVVAGCGGSAGIKDSSGPQQVDRTARAAGDEL